MESGVSPLLRPYLSLFIILPKFAMFNKQELVNMVREVNAEGVAMDEILSYTVYELSLIHI